MLDCDYLIDWVELNWMESIVGVGFGADESLDGAGEF